MKVLFTLLAALGCFTFQANASEILMDTYSEQKLEANQALACYEIRDQVLAARDAVEGNDKARATRILDRILRQLDQPNDPFTFTQYGIVYKTNDAGFRCDYLQQQRAIRIAEEGGERACFQKGLNSCRVLSSGITTNGYIGYLNGTYYGYGCVAEAVIRGTR